MNNIEITKKKETEQVTQVENLEITLVEDDLEAENMLDSIPVPNHSSMWWQNNALLSPYSEWIYKEAIRVPQPRCRYLIEITGYLIGLLSTSIAIPFAYDFGVESAEYIGISEEEFQKAIGSYFAITAVIPLALLNAQAVAARLKHLFLQQTQNSKNIHRQIYTKPYRIGIFIVCFQAALAASPTPYLTYDYLEDILGVYVYPLLVPAFLGPFFLAEFVFEKMYRLLFDKLKDATYTLSAGIKIERMSLYSKQKDIYDALRNTIYVIQKIDNSKVNKLSEFILKEQNTSDEESGYNNFMLAKTQAVLQPHKIIEVTTNTQFKRDVIQELFGFTGGLLTAASCYVNIPVGVQTSDALWSFLGITNTTFVTLSGILFASQGLFLGISLGSIIGYTIFKDIYSFLKKTSYALCAPSNWCPGFLPINRDNENLAKLFKNACYFGSFFLLIPIIAISSAIPNSFITAENSDLTTILGILIVVSAFVGQFSLNLYSLQQELNLRQKEVGNRKKLINILEKIQNYLYHLNEDILNELHHLVTDSPNLTADEASSIFHP